MKIIRAELITRKRLLVGRSFYGIKNKKLTIFFLFFFKGHKPAGSAGIHSMRKNETMQMYQANTPSLISFFCGAMVCFFYV